MTSALRILSNALRSEGFRKIGEERVMRVGTVRVYQRKAYRVGFKEAVPVEEAILYSDGNLERFRIGA